MGLPVGLGPSDARAPFHAVFLLLAVVNNITARFLLPVLGIRMENPSNVLEPMESTNDPSDAYVEKFRSRKSVIRCGSIHSTDVQEHECIVCLNAFEPEAEIHRLSCGHIFHKLCLEKWLKYRNVTCPLCRKNVLAQADEEDFSGVSRSQAP